MHSSFAATLGVGECHLLHEGDKVGLRAPVSGTPKDARRVHVHGGDEGLCAVPDVLELATSRTPWRRRAVRVRSLPERSDMGIPAVATGGTITLTSPFGL